MDDINKKLDELTTCVRKQTSQNRKNFEEIHVSIARLEEKVSFHQKGLGAIGAMVVAAVSATITQVFWKMFRNN